MSIVDSPSPSSASAETPPSAKSRRLSFKQPSEAHSPPVAPLPLVAELWKELGSDAFSALHHRRRYRYVYNKFMAWFQRNPETDCVKGSDCTKELWALAQVRYHELTRFQKNILLRHFLILSQAPDFIDSYAHKQWPVSAEDKTGSSLVIDAQTVLLTYQGNWGLVPAGNVHPALTDDELSAEVRKLPLVEDICKRFDEHCQNLCTTLEASQYACSVEICLSTWRKDNELRLHGHLFAKSPGGRMRCTTVALLDFEGCKPHMTNYVMSRTAKGWAGAYYVCAPKAGSIMNGGSLQRNVDFPVNPEWVFHLVESAKMSYENARGELIRCAKGCDRRLKDLDCWHKNTLELVLKHQVQRRQMEVRRGLRPFPKVRVVDDWVAEVMKPAQARKRFLVLDGPSMMGKTEFVRCLFPIGSVLELNAANLEYVTMSGFDASLHRCLLWDEALPKLVTTNRKVFQHPACWVDLGHSPTGQHVVNVFLNDCCSVIATNSWRSEVEKLCEEDQAWLAANAVVFVVSKPLWEDPLEAQPRSPLQAVQDSQWT